MTTKQIYCTRLIDFNKKELFQLENYCLIYFSKGNGSLQIDFKEYLFQKDDLFLISKNQLVELSTDKDITGFMMMFSAKIYDDVTSNSSLNDKQLFNYWFYEPKIADVSENFYGALVTLYKECKIANDSSINHEIICSNLKTILLKINRSTKNTGSKYLTIFNNFKYLIDCDIRNTRNSISYAEHLGISYKHLNNISKEIAKKTAKDFIKENTVLEIKRQMALGLTTNQVSRKLGFDEPTNFVKYRKRYLTDIKSELFDKI